MFNKHEYINASPFDQPVEYFRTWIALKYFHQADTPVKEDYYNYQHHNDNIKRTEAPGRGNFGMESILQVSSYRS